MALSPTVASVRRSRIAQDRSSAGIQPMPFNMLPTRSGQFANRIVIAGDDAQRRDARAGVRCADGGPRRPPTTADLIVTEDMSPGRQGLANAHIPMRVVDSRKAPDTSTFYLAGAHGSSDSPVLAGTTQKEAA